MTEEELMKQAKESWWNDDTCSGGMTTEKIYERGFVAGHKSGYQESLKAKINATTISDCPVKDEWHRLGKNPNDLPDEDVPVLCVRGGNIYVAWYSNNEWRGTRWEQVKKPYAWKEIELPKEEE